MDYASSLLGLLPGGRRTPGLKELLASVGTYLPPEQVARIREAAEFGTSAHRGQKRLSGEPFIAHPVAAAAILADLRLDADTIVAAILHDVIEDTPTPKDQLAARFGADVAELVDGVTKLDQIKFLKKIEQQLNAALLKSSIQAHVVARAKHLYSIYSKMRRKRAMLSEIVDVYGIRIVVDSPDTCYRALGAVHSVFKPMPARFKDYIAIPRVNGYQSLHTTLFGPNGVPIEVQIRTGDMHRVAEAGIAAHWKYKSGGDADSMQRERTREWLSNLVSLQEAGSSEEFLESVKVDLFPDKVYVFTPKGQILRLPSGATVVD